MRSSIIASHDPPFCVLASAHEKRRVFPQSCQNREYEACRATSLAGYPCCRTRLRPICGEHDITRE